MRKHVLGSALCCSARPMNETMLPKLPVLETSENHRDGVKSERWHSQFLRNFWQTWDRSIGFHSNSDSGTFPL